MGNMTWMLPKALALRIALSWLLNIPGCCRQNRIALSPRADWSPWSRRFPKKTCHPPDPEFGWSRGSGNDLRHLLVGFEQLVLCGQPLRPQVMELRPVKADPFGAVVLGRGYLFQNSMFALTETKCPSVVSAGRWLNRMMLDSNRS